ncbi:MFS transporter [Ktedonobacter sp. SOSP1-52]|uniref:MFS transporter n=1 Tax=Ktedonobacter sp. SOSP1-52 TaxID=2778366 RepID=UPI0019159DD5|nr:MFS transporter [Ktedonobacter sp. SOSP1-52]GHO71722.1 MFS transporter [Ktedonobacter sp. SOSP1-52]
MATIQTPSSSTLPARLDKRILLLALGMFALGTDAFVVAGVLPAISHDLTISEGAAGQLVTIFSLTYGLGAPVFAAISGRWSRNKVLLVALGAFCLVNVGSALAPNYLLLLLTRLLAGCTAATFAPLAYTTGTSLAPPQKQGKALSLVALGLTVATVFGSPLGTWIGEHMGWRLSFGLVALLAGIAFLALLLCGLPQVKRGLALSLKDRLVPIKEPHLLLALLPALLWNLGVYVTYTYLAPLLHSMLSLTDISVLLLAFGVGVIIGNVSGGTISDRLGEKRPLLIGLFLLTLTFALLPLACTSILGASIALFLWGLISSAIFTPQQHRLLALAPQHANVILALNNSTLYLGIAFGSAVGGIALQIVSVQILPWIGATIIALALLVLFLSFRVGTENPASSEE